jgi:hypothetical protein
MTRITEVLAWAILVAATWAPQDSKAFFGRRSDPKIDLMKCKSCSTPLADENWVQLEKIEKCSPDRRFLQKDILGLDRELIAKRENEVHQFPLACIVHAQRTFTFRTRAKPEDESPNSWSGLNVPGRSFGQCSTEEAEPVRGAYMPCVTSEYAYSVYNAFHDMADCFDINGRKLLPKLWNESGFHINTLGGGMDAGVGQLTRSAIEEVLSKPYVNDDRTALDVFKQQAMNSSKFSCQRLVRHEAAWQAVNPDVTQRCSIMTTPNNPIRNVVYLGVFYKLNERVVVSRMNSTKMKEKLEELGLQNPNMEYFQDAIVTLAFNMGRGSAFSIVESYLKSRLANQEKLQAKDLDFLNSSLEEVRAIRKEPKDESEEDRNKRIARLDAAKETAYKRTLPAFLRLMHGLQTDYETDPAKKRINGAPGYLTFVGERQKKYNTDLGDGVCTHASFLQYK